MRGPATLAATAMGFAAAGAYPTSLNIVPIAEILAHRNVSTFHAAEGGAIRSRSPYAHCSSIQFGILDRAEAGTETDYAGGETWNAKLLLTSTNALSISAGVMNARGSYVEPYSVASMYSGSAGVHLGWIRDSRSRAFIGMDYSLSEQLSLMAEHLTGRDGESWIGLTWQVPQVKGLSLTASFGLATTGSDRTRHMLTVMWDIAP